MPLSPDKLFTWALEYPKTHKGRMPTFREAARRFRVRQEVIEEMIYDWQGSNTDNKLWMDVCVGIQIGGGGGWGTYSSRGDYKIEASRQEEEPKS